VTPENQLAKFTLRGSSVLPQLEKAGRAGLFWRFSGSPNGFSLRRVDPAQFLCISRLTLKPVASARASSIPCPTAHTSWTC